MTTYGGLVSFGAYTFPATQQEASWRFGQIAQATVQVAGMDGYWDAHGMGAAPVVSNPITVTFYLISGDRAGMDALRDALLALMDYGLAMLVYQPTDVTDKTRWTMARGVPGSIQEDKGRHTDLWQKISMTFNAPEPSWKENNYGGIYVGQTGLVIDSPNANYLGEDGYTVAVSGVSTTDTIPYVGDKPTIPEISIEPQTGESCENIRIQRLDENYVVDEFKYTGVLSAGDILAIDGRRQSVTVNGVAVWGSFWSMNPDFLRLEPGKTDLRILCKNAGDEATVWLHFWDEYR